MMYSAYKLNKQGDNIQPWCTPFLIWNQCVVPCPVLTVASWHAYRFLTRQVRWSVIPISLRIFHRKLIELITWITALYNSMKLWAMLYRVTQDRWVMVEVLTKRGPLEKGMANHFSILALRTPWTVWKVKKIGHWKINSQGLWVSNMLLENCREITPERMKRWTESENTTHLWMWLVMEVKSAAVKNNIA